MTAKTVAAELPSGQVSGLVLGTTKRALEYYTAAKDFSPMLKSGLETVESRLPEEWAGRIEDLLKTQLDTRYDSLSATVSKAVADVNERVVAPVSKRVAEVNEQVSTRVVAPVSGVVTKTVAEVNTRVVVPVSQTVQELRAASWKDLRGEMSKKAMLRLEQGFTGVREFSATRGKEMIHVDLIEYSQQILDNARATASPLLVPVTEKVLKAVEDLKQACEGIKKAAAVKSAQTAEELQARLVSAKEAARKLGAQGAALVQEKYALLPERVSMEGMLTARLPANLHSSVKVIMDAPSLFAERANEVRAKAELDSEKKLLENIGSLLQAVRTVVFSSNTTPAAVSA